MKIIAIQILLWVVLFPAALFAQESPMPGTGYQGILDSLQQSSAATESTKSIVSSEQAEALPNGVESKSPAETEKKREDASPGEPERSRAEDFFSRMDTSVAGSVSGPAAKNVELEESEAARDALLARLLSDEDIPTPKKVGFYLQLDSTRRGKYLRSLSVEERDNFLKAIGEKERRYPEDLKTAKVDRILEQFGYEFFENRTPGFTPEGLAPVGPDYVVGPGDTLIISIWGNVDANYEATVDRNGDIRIPRVGVVHVWGQTFAEARETVRQQISKYFKNFEMNFSMGPLRSIQVYLVGEVNAPGTYTVSSLSTVLSALVAAGGPSKTGSLRDVQLVRDGEIVASIDFYDFFLNGDRSRDTRLQSGDTIHVPVTGPLVGVAGEVRRPAIYELNEGETIQEVLKMAGGVVSTAYLKRVQVERVEAHRKKTALDLDLSDAEDVDKAQAVTLQDRDLVLVSSISPTSVSYVSLEGYVARPGRYQFKEGMRLSDLITPYDNLLPDYFPGMAEILRLQPPAYRPEKLTVDLGRALAGDPTQNVPLQEFDEVHLFSREEMEESPEIWVSGAVLNPGSFRFYQNMTVKDLIAAAGNVRRRAFLQDAELSRFIPEGDRTRTERIHLNLDEALAGDTSQNIPLQPEDHLFVRSIPDYAERQTVELRGQVLFPGTYTVVRGEKLSSVIERAGGFAEGAYLRGAVFTRESVKSLQRQRLEKLVFEQEQTISRVSADIALGALSSEELQSAQALLQSRKALVQKLKEAPVTGRMVVHLEPLGEFEGSDSDLELTDGDTITIPENPKSVTVLGQVYNSVTLSYRPGKTVDYYLANVGGPKENANTDEMFVVRANGTVYSKQQAGAGIRWDGENHRWVMGGFNATELYPGDTVLVPEEVKRLDILREVKDLTTILYQMALGAAAVASF